MITLETHKMKKTKKQKKGNSSLSSNTHGIINY